MARANHLGPGSSVWQDKGWRGLPDWFSYAFPYGDRIEGKKHYKMAKIYGLSLFLFVYFFYFGALSFGFQGSSSQRQRRWGKQGKLPGSLGLQGDGMRLSAC